MPGFKVYTLGQTGIVSLMVAETLGINGGRQQAEILVCATSKKAALAALKARGYAGPTHALRVARGDDVDDMTAKGVFADGLVFALKLSPNTPVVTLLENGAGAKGDFRVHGDMIAGKYQRRDGDDVVTVRQSPPRVFYVRAPAQLPAAVAGALGVQPGWAPVQILVCANSPEAAMAELHARRFYDERRVYLTPTYTVDPAGAVGGHIGDMVAKGVLAEHTVLIMRQSRSTPVLSLCKGGDSFRIRGALVGGEFRERPGVAFFRSIDPDAGEAAGPEVAEAATLTGADQRAEALAEQLRSVNDQRAGALAEQLRSVNEQLHDLEVEVEATRAERAELCRRLVADHAGVHIAASVLGVTPGRVYHLHDKAVRDRQRSGLPDGDRWPVGSYVKVRLPMARVSEYPSAVVVRPEGRPVAGSGQVWVQYGDGSVDLTSVSNLLPDPPSCGECPPDEAPRGLTFRQLAVHMLRHDR